MTQAAQKSERSSARAWVVSILTLIIVGLIGIGLWWWMNQSRFVPPPIAKELPVPKNLPGIEPLEVSTIAPEEALKLNEQQPFLDSPPVPAKPFILASNGADMNRAVDCLASAIHYEAGNETREGKMAVAQVVLNRMRHPAYPKTVCGVVYQGIERGDKLCQFSFACDGSIANRRPMPGAWTNAQTIARQMLTGTVYKPVGWATHYHTDWVFPSWSTKLDKVWREGTHLFFRWREFWGTPQAFRGRYAGAEPNEPPLAGLSPYHLPDLTLPPELQAGTMTGVDALGNVVEQPLLIPETPAALPAPPQFAKRTFSNASGDYQLYHVNPSAAPEALLSLSLRACGERDYCKVLIWTDGRVAPSALPVSDDALKKLAFSYLRNRSTGFEKPLWDCGFYNRQATGQCIKHQGTPPREAAPLPRPQPSAPANLPATPAAQGATQTPSGTE